MRDFPPDVRAYDGPSFGESDFGKVTSGPGPIREPRTDSPRVFLTWMMAQHGVLFVVGLLVSTVWMVPQTVGPWIIGRAIDTGIVGGDQGALARWIVLLAVVTVVGASSGVLYHTVIVREWLIAIYGSMLLVTRKTLQLGHVLPRRVPTGEVLSVAGSDGDQFGAFSEIATRAFSNLLAYLGVAAIVLTTSVRMGLLVLLAAPLLVVLGAPLLRPLHYWQGLERARNSELTSMGTDIVAGLRILRGIGGERTFGGNYTTQSRQVRDAGVRAGRWLGAVEAVGVALSGAFVVALLWLGVREVADGQLTVGQLVSLLGYGLFLVQPMRTFVEFAQKWTRVSVSAVKAVAVLEQQPPWQEPEVPRALTGGVIIDATSGLTIEPGLLTMVVSAVPDDAAALADRIGRYLPHADSPGGRSEAPEELRGRAARRARAAKVTARREQARLDEVEAGRAWGVTVGGVDLAEVPLDEVRHHIMVSEATPYVFAGTLRSALDPVGRLSRADAERALHTAAAEDVFDALPDGWQGELEERGRGLSGGQRQRLVLARAVAADPEVLILVEPTSAVDAHTEAAIAERLGPHRAGRTTVVMTASPLLLHHADDIALLEGGRVVARGRHADLLAGNTAYRNVVARAAARGGPGDAPPAPAADRDEAVRR